MKDRIRQVMELQRMTQQEFAQFIDVSPASLSSIFNGRTKPTLNIVEAIKKKISNINTDWLMFGSGSMYMSDNGNAVEKADNADNAVEGYEQLLDFDVADASVMLNDVSVGHHNNVKTAHQDAVIDEVKYIDKHKRRVTEIRVYYDDQTYETFVPSSN